MNQNGILLITDDGDRNGIGNAIWIFSNSRAPSNWIPIKPPFDYEQQCQAHSTGRQAIAPSSVEIEEGTNLISGRSSRFFQSTGNEIEINSSFGSYDQFETKIDQIDELDFQEEYTRKIKVFQFFFNLPPVGTFSLVLGIDWWDFSSEFWKRILPVVSWDQGKHDYGWN